MLAKICRILLGACALAVSLTNGTSSAAPGGMSRAQHAPAGIPARVRSRAAVTPSYTIRDLGTPSGYTYSLPSGFNSTGQIFGEAVISVEGFPNVQDCFVWTGTAFRRLPLAPPATPGSSCTPSGINDADPKTGAYEIVGSATEEFTQYAHAFTLGVTASGFKTPTIFYAYAPSGMVGVNGAGTALAAASFNRDTAFDIAGQLYFTATAGAASLTPLQPPTATSPPASHYLIPTYATACVFGGCAINDRNEVLGYDYSTLSSYDSTRRNGFTATAAIAVVGQPASLLHIPIQDLALNPVFGIGVVDPFADDYPVALNNANQLFYYDQSYAAAALFDVDSGVRTIITVPGACPGNYVAPLSLNNRGEALGESTDCSGYALYWTWDTTRGVQIVNAQIPASNDTIYPLGVNDNGQILIDLRTSGGFDRWGTLDPVSTTSKVRFNILKPRSK